MRQLHKYLSITLFYPYLLILFISRCILYSYSYYHEEIHFKFNEIIEIFFKGIFFDFLGYIYILLPILTINLFIPIKWRFNKLYQYFLLIICYLFILSLILIEFFGFLFWEAFSTRFNSKTISYFFDIEELKSNIVGINNFAVYIVIILIAFIPFFAFNKNFTRSINNYISSRIKKYQFWIVIFLSLLVKLYFDPYAINSNNIYINELSNNSIFNSIKPSSNSLNAYQNFYKNNDLEDAFANVREQLLQANQQYINDKLDNIKRNVKYIGSKKKLNVILITVADLNNEFIGKKNNNKNITPYISNLIKKSIYVSNFYANDTNSNRNLEATILGLPPLPGDSEFLTKISMNQKTLSLAQILKENDYSLRFTYAGDHIKPTYYTNDFFVSHGFFNEELYYNISKLEKKFRNEAGLADQDVFDQVLVSLDKVNSDGKLFYQHIQTTSSKYPYTYPDNKIDIVSGTEGREGAIKYADYALGTFIEKAKTKKWFKDTIFIITADRNYNDTEKEISIDQYQIPLIIYSPDNYLPKVINKLSSQIDLAPTILGLLNISYQSNFFGNDIFNKEKDFIMIRRNKSLGYYQDGKLIVLSPQIKKRRNKNIKLDAYYNPLENLAISLYQVASKYNFLEVFK